MNQILCSDWVTERMELVGAILPAWDYSLYYSFTDQACSVKMAECWPRSFLFMDLDSHFDLTLGQ